MTLVTSLMNYVHMTLIQLPQAVMEVVIWTKYLITEHGCDPALPDIDGDMPINIACLGGQLNVVKYLVK